MDPQHPPVCIHVKLDPKNVDNIKDVILRIQSKWKKTDIVVESLGGSIHPMFCCHLAVDAGKQRALMIRIVDDLSLDLIGRTREVIGMQIANQAGCGFALRAILDNALIMDYCIGKTLSHTGFMDPKISRSLCRSLARFHSINTDNATVVGIDGRREEVEKLDPIILMEMLIDIIPPDYPNPNINERLVKAIGSRAELVKEGRWLLKLVESLRLPLVFSHNDVNHRNALYDAQKDVVYLIGLEMCSHSYPAMDIIFYYYALPMWGKLGLCTAEEGASIVSKEFMQTLYTTYLEETNKCQQRTAPVSQQQLDCFSAQAEICACVMFFTYCLSMLGEVGKPAQFDPVEQACIAAKEYFLRKEKLESYAEEYKRLCSVNP